MCGCEPHFTCRRCLEDEAARADQWPHDDISARRHGPLKLLAENLSDAEYAYIAGKLGEGAMGRLFGV